MTVDEYARIWLKAIAEQYPGRDAHQVAIAYLLQLIAVDHTHRQMYQFDLPAPSGPVIEETEMSGYSTALYQCQQCGYLWLVKRPGIPAYQGPPCPSCKSTHVYRVTGEEEEQEQQR